MYTLPNHMEGAPIVYVEDSANDAELFSRSLLQMRPHSKLFHFRDGKSAQDFLSTFETHDPLEMIVVDIFLPGLNGKDLIQWIRKQPALQKVPVVAISGSRVFKSDEEAREIGADIFLLKPQDYNGWIDLVYQVDDFTAAHG